MESLKCLEFFAGIGGFHFALKESLPECQMLAAFDINTVTNMIYKINFPNTKIFQRNIQALSSELLDQFSADVWMLSPPCQPFTCKGVQRDLNDRRCDGLTSLCSELRKMKRPPCYIMVENVCGFETSSACTLLRETLTETGYEFEEFILSPLQLGIPNSRPRYYLLARICKLFPNSLNKLNFEFPEELQLHICRNLSIGDFLDKENSFEEHLVLDSSSIMRYVSSISLVARVSKQSACFTKSYSFYLKGSGSVLVTSPELQIEYPKDEILRLLSSSPDTIHKQDLVKSFGLRFFSWREVANLLGFPKSLQKPNAVSNKQMYRALGNSVSVFVVRVLLKYLLCSKNTRRLSDG